MTMTAPAPSSPPGYPEGIVSAISGRWREVHEAYREHRATGGDGCPFCAATPGSDEVVEVSGSMLVVVNMFPYAAWDNMRVVEHLMVVPTRHLFSKSEFTADEVVDWWEVVQRYEERGFSVYTRSPDNAARSVAHLHTHLIRTDGWIRG